MRHQDATEARRTGGQERVGLAGVMVLATGSMIIIPAALVAASLWTAEAAAVGGPLPSPSLPAVPSPSLPPIASPTLPVHLPTPTPSAPTVSPPPLPTPLPTPSLPITLGTPSPSVPGILPSPTSSPIPVGGSGSGSSGGTGSGTSTGSGGSHGGPGGGIPIPFTGVVLRSPLDIALLGAAAVLPVLLLIWLLLFGRTWNEARRARDAQIRLAIAHDLGLTPRELISVSTRSLFRLREEAAFDELTGVLRRAAGIAALDREVHRARRQKSPLSVAFIDIDGLKQANDTRGHKAGDEMLRNLAATLKDALRGQDLVIRYGGDEFVCILPDTVADAARAKLSWIQTEAEKSGLSFSSGVAALERTDDVVSLLGRADTEMYAVKARRGVVRDLRLGVIEGGPRLRKTAT